MGLFFPERRVTKEEFVKVRNELSRSGHFNNRQLEQVSSLFHGDMDESNSSSSRSGVEARELESSIKYLQEKKSKLGLDDNQINLIHEAMKKHL